MKPSSEPGVVSPQFIRIKITVSVVLYTAVVLFVKTQTKAGARMSWVEALFLWLIAIVASVVMTLVYVRHTQKMAEQNSE